MKNNTQKLTFFFFLFMLLHISAYAQDVTKLGAKPDKTVDVKLLEKHKAKYPERWKLAYQFLSQLDTANLKFGKFDLSPSVYATVTEYTTKEESILPYESHRKYIDIQYVVKGSEYMDVTHDTTLVIDKKYNEEHDYETYKAKKGNRRLATPQNYFIFFPSDIHRPSICVKKPMKICKVVIKLKVD